MNNKLPKHNKKRVNFYQKQIKKNLIQKLSKYDAPFPKNDKILGFSYNYDSYAVIFIFLLTILLPTGLFIMFSYMIQDDSYSYAFRGILLSFGLFSSLLLILGCYIRYYHYKIYILTEFSIHIYHFDKRKGGCSCYEVIYYDQIKNLSIESSNGRIKQQKGKIILILEDDGQFEIDLKWDFGNFIHSLFSILHSNNHLIESLLIDPIKQKEKTKSTRSEFWHSLIWNFSTTDPGDLIEYEAPVHYSFNLPKIPVIDFQMNAYKRQSIKIKSENKISQYQQSNQNKEQNSNKLNVINKKDTKNNYITKRSKYKMKRLIIDIICLPIYVIFSYICYALCKNYIFPIKSDIFIVFFLVIMFVLIVILASFVFQIIEIIKLINNSNKIGSKVIIHRDRIEINHSLKKNNRSILFEENIITNLHNRTKNFFPKERPQFYFMKISYLNSKRKYKISDIDDIFGLYRCWIVNYIHFLEEKAYYLSEEKLNSNFRRSVFYSHVMESYNRYLPIKQDFELFFRLVEQNLETRKLITAKKLVEQKRAELKKTKHYHLINICYILEDKILKYKRLDFLFDIEDCISLDDFAKKTGYLKEDVFKIFSLNQDILKDFELTGEYLVRKTKDLALQFIEKLDQQFNQWESNKDENDVKKN